MMKIYSVILLLANLIAVQGAMCNNKHGSQRYPAYSCLDILKQRCDRSSNGIYWIVLRTALLKPFPVFCDMNAGGWTLVFKAVAGVPGVMLKFWKLSYPMYEYSLAALNTRNNYKHHYKNRIVQHWSTFKPKQARLVLYKGKEEEIALRFNAYNSNNLDWFSFGRLEESPWVDIAAKTKNHFSVDGWCGGGYCRSFYINHFHGGCPKDVGWLSLGGGHVCAWEKRIPEASFLYSKKDTHVNWNQYDQVGLADVFAIYLR